jgi:hypothetical protein
MVRSIRRFWPLGHDASSFFWLSAHGAHTASDRAYREALQRWLRWDAAVQDATGALFARRRDPAAQQLLLDQLEQLRQEARRASRELLGRDPSGNEPIGD